VKAALDIAYKGMGGKASGSFAKDNQTDFEKGKSKINFSVTSSKKEPLPNFTPESLIE